MTSSWNWAPRGGQGIWRYGTPLLRSLSTLAPFLTVLLIVLEFHMISGTLASSQGVLFDLPESGIAEGEPTGLVAIVIPKGRESLVFFDDARYLLGDASSLAGFADHLADRIRRSDRKNLLVLADRLVPGGDLMSLAAIARKGGAERILFAEKRKGDNE